MEATKGFRQLKAQCRCSEPHLQLNNPSPSPNQVECNAMSHVPHQGDARFAYLNKSGSIQGNFAVPQSLQVLSRLRVVLRNTTPALGKSLRIKIILFGIHPPRQDKRLPPLSVILSREDRGVDTLGEVHMPFRLAQHRVLLCGSSLAWCAFYFSVSTRRCPEGLPR
jgi:hypothetical protein